MAPWFLLLMYPVVILLIVQPTAFRWQRQHPPPKDAGLLHAMREAGRHNTEGLQERALYVQTGRRELEQALESSGRWLLVGKFLVAGVLLCIWAKWCGYSISSLGILSLPLPISLLTGVVAGALLVCGKIVFQAIIKPLPFMHSEPWKHPLSRGPVAMWIVTFAVGSAFEEPWRALCLLAFMDSNWAKSFAVIVISLAFVFTQVTGFPARAPSNVEELWTFLVGVFLAFLFLRFGTVAIPFLTSLVFNIVNFFLIRKDVSSCRYVPRPSGKDVRN